MPRIATLGFLLALVPGAFAQANVWSVGSSPNVDFATIQEAIDASTAGDVIVVFDGNYDPFDVTGKGLSIVGFGSSAVVRAGFATVSDVPAGQRMLLRNLTFESEGKGSLGVEDCEGVVWLEGIRRPALFSAFVFALEDEVRIRSSETVAITSVSFEGHDGFEPAGYEPKSALVAEESHLFVFNSTFEGGTGWDDVNSNDGNSGADAMSVTGGQLVARGSVITGGGGGSPQAPFPDAFGGWGGHGLVLEDTEAWSLGTALVGGEGGDDIFVTEPGLPGDPYTLSGSSSIVEENVHTPMLRSTPVVRDDVEGENAELELDTLPNAPCFLLGQLHTSTLFFFPELREVLATGLSPIILPAGTTDEEGKLAFSIDIPSVPTGFSTWSMTLQMIVFEEYPEFELSNPTVVTIIDQDS